MNLDGFALPVKKLKGTDPVETLDLSRKSLGVASAVVIASLFGVNGLLTVTNLLHNELDAEAAKMLAEVAKQKGISLCGIQRDKTTADFSKQSLNPSDAMLLASDLSQAVVTGGLTSLDLSINSLFGVNVYGGTYTAEGITAIADALRVNGALTKIDVRWNIFGPEGAKVFADALRVNGGLTVINLSGNQLCGIWTDWRGQHGTYTAEGINAIADALRVNVGLTALDLSSNNLKDEGVSAVCEAIQSNKETKLASLNMGKNRIGSVGAKSVAAMVAVTVGLTATNLLGNWLDVESAKMLAEVAKQKGISLCGIQRDQTIADFSYQNLKLPDAILLASDLSQAIVTGALTVANLLSNQLNMKSAKMLAEVAKQKGISLCGIKRDQTTADFSDQGLKPPDAILLASDLSQAVVTGGLAKIK